MRRLMLGSSTARAAGGSAIPGRVRSPTVALGGIAIPGRVRSPTRRFGIVSSTSTAWRGAIGGSTGPVPFAARDADAGVVAEDRTTGSMRLHPVVAIVAIDGSAGTGITVRGAVVRALSGASGADDTERGIITAGRVETRDPLS